MKWLMNLYKGILLTENNSPINMGTYKYPGDKAKNDNGKIFDGNVDARNHRAEVERMIS